jgi:WhiB family redox-sensing transcriptional regulator
MHQRVDQKWRDSARCREVDPELWYPEIGESPHAAKRICGVCPVREACLADALGRREPHGVWGGLTTNERHAVLRERYGRGGRARRAA